MLVLMCMVCALGTDGHEALLDGGLHGKLCLRETVLSGRHFLAFMQCLPLKFCRENFRTCQIPTVLDTGMFPLISQSTTKVRTSREKNGAGPCASSHGMS